MSTSTIRSQPSRSARAISPKYIILSGANRPPPRIWRGMKVSVITRAPAARSRAAAARPRSLQVDPPSNSTGFAASFIARATASTAADGGGGALGGTIVGPLRVAGDQAQSAGRIRLAEPPGGP